MYNKENSEFYNSDDETIIMTIGNYLMQEYVINTKDDFDFYKCLKLHELLYSKSPYPEYSGKFRINGAMILRGGIQPVNYININEKMELLNNKSKDVLKNIDNYNFSEYISIIVPYIYEFIIIHPFNDGNGRVSRALLNWLLKMKNLPPIYIDELCKEEYYNSLIEIDKNGNYDKLILLVEKRIINTLMELHDYLHL